MGLFDKNDPDDIYGSNPQIEFARKMAEALLTGKGGFKGLPAEVAHMPGAGLNYGGMNILNAIQGAQYRDIAGSQESRLINRATGVNKDTPVTFGNPVPRTPGRQASLFPSVPGVVPPAITGDKKLSETGSISPTPSDSDPIKSASIYDALVNEVKKSENLPLFNGAKTRSAATFDFKQYSNGYGTKANHPSEIIDKPEAERRFAEQWAKREAAVDKFKPGLDPGTRAALVSLTYNSGEAWMKGELGKAIKEGNLQRAREIFLQYNRAGGKKNPVLEARRIKEAQWFGRGAEEPAKVAAITPPTEELTPPPELRGTVGEGPIPGQTGALPKPGAMGAEGNLTPAPAPNIPFAPNMPRTAAVPPPRGTINDITPVQPGGSTEIEKPIIPKELTGRIPETIEPQQAAKLPIPSPGMPGALNRSPQEAVLSPTIQSPNIPSPGELNLQPNNSDRLKQRNDQLEDMLNKIPSVPPSGNKPIEAYPPGRMNAGLSDIAAGLDTPGPSGAPGQKIAQAGQPFQSTIAGQPRQTNIMDVPGYGPFPVPPIPYLESLDQLNARVRLAPAEERDKIIDSYQKRAEGKIIKVPTGEIHIAPSPGGGEPIVSFVPSLPPTEPGKVYPGVTPQGKPKFDMTLPGEVGGNLSNGSGLDRLRDFFHWKQETEAHGGAISERFTNLAKQQSDIVNHAIGAPEQIRGLQSIEAISKSVDPSRGPTKDMVMRARQLVDDIAPGLSGAMGFDKEGLSGSELIEKLNMAMAMAATRTITSRGTNFDIMTNMRTNPGLSQSKGGTEMLVDVLQQDHKAKIEIANKVNKLKPWELDKLPDIVADHYKNNPLVLTYPDGKKVTVHKIEDNAEGKAFYDKLPNGMGYIAPDGKVRYKK